MRTTAARRRGTRRSRARVGGGTGGRSASRGDRCPATAGSSRRPAYWSSTSARHGSFARAYFARSGSISTSSGLTRSLSAGGVQGPDATLAGEPRKAVTGPPRPSSPTGRPALTFFPLSTPIASLSARREGRLVAIPAKLVDPGWARGDRPRKQKTVRRVQDDLPINRRVRAGGNCQEGLLACPGPRPSGHRTRPKLYSRKLPLGDR
jgi:hypothetical protein